MNEKLIFGLVVLGAFPALGAIDFGSGTLNASIPDNDPSGYTSTIAVDVGPGVTLGKVAVQLDISGGYNGDLYAYLTYDGQTVALLDRVGQGTGSNPTLTYGYSDSGLNVTLADGAANGNIHNYQGVGGSYSSLISSGGSFTPDSGGATLDGTYGGLDPNGNWTLFISDLSAGDQSTLVSWSVDVTAVPEPINAALGGLGLLALGAAGLREYRRRRYASEKTN